jgi:hypothetical protein
MLGKPPLDLRGQWHMEQVGVAQRGLGSNGEVEGFLLGATLPTCLCQPEARERQEHRVVFAPLPEAPCALQCGLSTHAVLVMAAAASTWSCRPAWTHNSDARVSACSASSQRPSRHRTWPTLLDDHERATSAAYQVCALDGQHTSPCVVSWAARDTRRPYARPTVTTSEPRSRDREHGGQRSPSPDARGPA